MSLFKGRTAQVCRVTFSSSSELPRAPETVWVSAWASPREVSRGSSAQEDICLKLHTNGAEVASPWEMLGTARFSTQKRAKMVQTDTNSDAQRERADERRVRMSKHIFALVILFCIVNNIPVLLQPPPKSDYQQETKFALMSSSITSISKSPCKGKELMALP